MEENLGIDPDGVTDLAASRRTVYEVEQPIRVSFLFTLASSFRKLCLKDED